MRFLGTVLAALVLGLSSAYAQTVVGPVENGGLSHADLSGANITATGGTTARTSADRAADLMNVRDFGAKGDAKILSVSATISAGSTNLTVGTGTFSAADVGKTLILGNAGVSPTSGPALTIPIVSAGSGYASVPSCAITDGSGSGSGATCSAFMGLQSSTLVTGGSGCAADGTYEFIVGIDGSGTPARFTATVSGGAVTGALTVTIPGLVSALGTLSGAPAYGANCTTAPTVNLSYGLAGAQVTAQGAGYSTAQTTAALSGGSPTVAAVLGAPLIGAPVPPLVTTIAGYTSSTQVTLAAAASTALSNAGVQILYGSDDGAAIQAAINSALGKSAAGVWLPSGIYWVGAKLDPQAGNLVFRGEGPTASVLAWDAGTVTTQNAAGWSPLFGDTGSGRSSMRGSLSFEDLQFRGLLDLGRVNTGAAALELNYYKEVAFDRTRFYQVPDMAMALEGVDRYRVQNSTFDTVMRDQARCRSCFSAIVRGNSFVHSDDDSVALHQANYIQGAGNVREALIVEGNTFEDTLGVHILGARQAIIRGNTFRRTKVGAIRLEQDSAEGVNPIRSIIMADNIAEDVLTRAPFTGGGTAIDLTYSAATSPTGVTRMVPGSSIAGTSYILKPWNLDLGNTQSGASYAAGTRGISVHDNHILRTLPAAANYSAWGFGQLLTKYGFIDPVVPDVGLTPVAGINLSVNVAGAQIHHNVIQNVRRGVSIQDNVLVPQEASIAISQNQIIDAWEYGVVGFGTGSMAQFDLKDNYIDVDPYQLSAGRTGGHGAWSSGYGSSKCFSSTYNAMVQMVGNTFANCYSVQTGTGWLIANNYLRGSPWSGTTGALGSWTSANFGLGTYPAVGGGQFTVLNTAMDPSLGPATYGALNNPKTTSASAAPTTGWHAVGEIVWSTNPSGCSCVGWQAITTGSGWTAGTDYKTIPIQ